MAILSEVVGALILLGVFFVGLRGLYRYFSKNHPTIIPPLE